MICQNCKVEFVGNKTRRYCSIKCFASTNQRKALAIRHSRWKQTFDAVHGEKHCGYCGNEMTLADYNGIRSRLALRKFCSKACAQAAVAARKRADGASYSKLGYVVISKPDCCDMHRGIYRRYEHLLKAEHVMERRIKKGEAVHHIDGNKSNNRNNNLLICTNSYHKWLHSRMGSLYQQEKFGSQQVAV